MTAVTEPKDMKQTVKDLEAAILSLCDMFEEATDFQVSLINFYEAHDPTGKPVNKVTVTTKVKL